jgi:hypothetical protein
VHGQVVAFPGPIQEQDKAIEAAKVSEWARGELTVTGNRNDVVLFKELKELYTGDQRDFKLHLNAYLSALDGVVFKDLDRVKRDEVNKPIRDVIRGARLS